MNSVVVNTLLIVAVLAIVMGGVYGMNRRTRKGCCETGDDVKIERIKVKAKDVKSYPHKVEVSINGMTCDQCAKRIENAFNGQNGVYAQVDRVKKEAFVYSEQDLDKPTIIRLVREAGYMVEAIKVCS